MIGESDALSAQTLKARLARGAALAFAINVGGTGLAFLSQMVLARILGAEGYGIYAYVTAWVAILGLVATLGFRTALLRFASSYWTRQEWSLLRGVGGYATGRVAVAGIGLGCALAAAVIALDERLSPELSRTFLVGAGIVPLLALLHVRSALLRAFHRIGWALAPQMIVRHVVMLLLVIALSLSAGGAVRAHWAMAAMLLGAGTALLCIIVALRRAWPQPARAAPVAREEHEWRRAALPLFLMVVIQAALSRTDVVMVGWLSDTTAAGGYAVAARTAELVGFALTAMNTIFAPSIAGLHARGDSAGLQALVTTTARWTALSALLIAAPLFVLAEWILSLFGDAFVAGAPALRILLIGQLLNAAAGSVGYLMTMTGHERHAATIFGSAALLQILLYVVLVPRFGLIGAAAASAATMVAWNLALAIVVWRKLGIVPGPLGFR